MWAEVEIFNPQRKKEKWTLEGRDSSKNPGRVRKRDEISL